MITSLPTQAYLYNALSLTYGKTHDVMGSQYANLIDNVLMEVVGVNLNAIKLIVSYRIGCGSRADTVVLSTTYFDD